MIKSIRNLTLGAAGLAAFLLPVFSGVTTNSVMPGVVSQAAGASNGLLTSLTSHWKVDETSGTRADSHGSYDLSEFSGAVTYSATAIFGNSADLEGAEGASNSLRSSDAIFDGVTTQSWTVNFWVNFDAIPGTFTGPFFQIRGTTAGTEWKFMWQHDSSHIFKLYDGSHYSATFSSFSPTTSTWYMLTFGYDYSVPEVWVQVDAGTRSTASATTVTSTGLTDLRFGFEKLNAKLDSMSFWLGKSLSEVEVTALYNSGSGLDYDDFD